MNLLETWLLFMGMTLIAVIAFLSDDYNRSRLIIQDYVKLIIIIITSPLSWVALVIYRIVKFIKQIPKTRTEADRRSDEVDRYCSDRP